jgi:tetratricopeptide (TPR) repeat protein
VVTCVLAPTDTILAQPSDHGWVPSRVQAHEQFRAFNYVDAAWMYHEVLKGDTTDFDALIKVTESWNLRGLDLQAAGQKDSAEVSFERAVKYAEQTFRHYPDSAATYVNLAAANGNLALFRGGKAKVRTGRDVQRYCMQALQIDSTNVVALTILGVFHREVSKLSWIERLVAKTVYGGLPKGSIDKSVEYLRKAIEVDSTALFPNYSLAVTYRRMKEHQASLQQLEIVSQLRAGNSEEARYLSQTEAWLEEEGRK